MEIAIISSILLYILLCLVQFWILRKASKALNNIETRMSIIEEEMTSIEIKAVVLGSRVHKLASWYEVGRAMANE